MIRRRGALIAAVAVTGIAGLTACSTGSASSPSSTGSVSSTPNGSQPTGPAVTNVAFSTGTAQQNNAAPNTGDFVTVPDNPASRKWVQLSGGSANGLNPIVRNGAGFTLYRFDKDTAKPSQSTCTGDCAKKWPPVLVKPGSKVFLDGIQQSDVGFVDRGDGTLQATLGGWPVYRFAKDTAPGQTNGQGVGGTWFAVTPDGSKTDGTPKKANTSTGVNLVSGTANRNKAKPNTGDFFNGPSTDPAAKKWVQLTAGSANGLNPIVVNGRGFTYYRFDKDTAAPSKSSCNGDCAKTWPPVLVVPGSRIFVDGVKTARVGIVTRADGGRQVTIGGWPIYRFSKDTAPGQTNGEGVGGTWFAISPTGAKVLPAEKPSATPTSAPATTQPPAGTLGDGTVILDSGKNFSEPNGSQAVRGPGCQNTTPGLAGSLVLNGGPVKIWTGPNCTGTSAIVTQNVPDLAAIGFDKKVASIRFGG